MHNAFAKEVVFTEITRQMLSPWPDSRLLATVHFDSV